MGDGGAGRAALRKLDESSRGYSAGRELGTVGGHTRWGWRAREGGFSQRVGREEPGCRSFVDRGFQSALAPPLPIPRSRTRALASARPPCGACAQAEVRLGTRDNAPDMLRRAAAAHVGSFVSERHEHGRALVIVGDARPVRNTSDGLKSCRYCSSHCSAVCNGEVAGVTRR